jgi:FKBP-type peptidyl-prolyl cis-trans isomerase
VNRTETASGLIIEDLKIGTGLEAKAHDTVTIHYRGTLPSGEEFDSSYKTGQPATFPLDRLIKGWQEGIPGMKIGGKRRLTVPPELGYGKRGSPPVIPPDATLVFEIELFAVNGQKG